MYIYLNVSVILKILDQMFKSPTGSLSALGHTFHQANISVFKKNILKRSYGKIFHFLRI